MKSVDASPLAVRTPTRNFSRCDGGKRRCSSLTHTSPSVVSSLRASQSTICRQNRLWTFSKPCIHQCQVESPAKAITRPAP